VLLEEGADDLVRTVQVESAAAIDHDGRQHRNVAPALTISVLSASAVELELPPFTKVVPV